MKLKIAAQKQPTITITVALHADILFRGPWTVRTAAVDATTRCRGSALASTHDFSPSAPVFVAKREELKARNEIPSSSKLKMVTRIQRLRSLVHGRGHFI